MKQLSASIDLRRSGKTAILEACTIRDRHICHAKIQTVCSVPINFQPRLLADVKQAPESPLWLQPSLAVS